MKTETKPWVEQAKDDYETAKAMLESHRYGYTCFCSQQVLEKIFKAAVIEFADKRPAKIHDLVKLAEDSTFKIKKSWFEKLGEMSKHYFRVRYPDMHKGLYTNNKVAGKTFKGMEEIYQWVLKKLNR